MLALSCRLSRAEGQAGHLGGQIAAVSPKLRQRVTNRLIKGHLLLLSGSCPSTEGLSFPAQPPPAATRSLPEQRRALGQQPWPESR